MLDYYYKSTIMYIIQIENEKWSAGMKITPITWCPLNCLNFPRVGAIADIDIGGYGGEGLADVADGCAAHQETIFLNLHREAGHPVLPHVVGNHGDYLLITRRGRYL